MTRFTFATAVLSVCVATGLATDERVANVALISQSAAVITLDAEAHVAWDIAVPVTDALTAFEFAIYVDGIRQPLPRGQCQSIDPANATCAAPLPSLTAGRHVIEMVTLRGATESSRSDPLVVEVGPTPATAQAAAGPSRMRDADHPRRPVDQSHAATPSEVVDLAIIPSGGLIVANRDGRVRIARGERTREAAVLTDADTRSGLGLFAVALHPSFERNRYVYLVYAARSQRGGAVYRVIRTREVDDRLAEPAVLIDDVPAAGGGWATARFGPDEKLYIALGDSASNVSRDGHPYLGAVLRLEDDGSTPRDSPSFSPVIMEDIGVPRGITWTPDGTLWIASSERNGVSRVRSLAGAVYTLPSGAVAGGIAAVRTRASGGVELWIGRLDDSGVHIIPLNRSSATASALSTLRAHPYGATRCVVATTEGGAYLCAGDSDVRGRGVAGIARVPSAP